MFPLQPEDDVEVDGTPAIINLGELHMFARSQLQTWQSSGCMTSSGTDSFDCLCKLWSCVCGFDCCIGVYVKSVRGVMCL